jgi:hypothetical protein
MTATVKDRSPAVLIAIILMMSVVPLAVGPGHEEGDPSAWEPSGDTEQDASGGARPPGDQGEKLPAQAFFPALRRSVAPGNDFDLTSDRETIIFGPGSDDNLGSALASGDLNGDGYDDIIMGAPTADGPGDAHTSAGEVWVIFGDGAGLNTSYDLAGESSMRLHGPATGEKAGYSLAVADFNGDSKDDLIIGAPDAGGPSPGRDNCGRVYVVYGDVTSGLAGTHDLGAFADVIVYGPSAGANLGVHGRRVRPQQRRPRLLRGPLHGPVGRHIRRVRRG